MSNTEYVTAAKPRVGGGIYVGPVTATLPTDAVSEIPAEFEKLGYISEDGVTISKSQTIETQKAWGGDEVLTINQGRENTVQFKLLESLNVSVLKYAYGEDNVSGDLETGIKVNINSKDVPQRALIIDTILAKGDVLGRICIPKGSLGELGDISLSDSEAVGLDVTVRALADEAGNTSYEYYSKATATTA